MRLPVLTLVLAAALAGCVNVPSPSRPGSGARADDLPTPPTAKDADRIARLHMELAGGYFSRGQTDTALDEIRQVLAVRPDLPEAYNMRGLIYASLGRAADAEASFRRALQLKPDDPDTEHNFGWFLCQERRYREADVQFDAALAQPQYRERVRTLLAQGVCMARDGRWADAEHKLLQSYELAPGNPATAYNLTDVLYHEGQYARARFYIARVNAVREQSNAQTLWLAIRIEHKLGNTAGVQDLGRQLNERFPQSTEAMRYERGHFDE